MSTQVTHALKTWPEYFEEMREGRKKFEIRYNDRAFRVGDILLLREYLPTTKCYTGRELKAVVTYMLDFHVGLVDGYVGMSIELLDDLPF